MSYERSPDDDREGRLLKLVQLVLMRPEEERDAFLKDSPLEKTSLSQAPVGGGAGAWSAFLDQIGRTRSVWEDGGPRKRLGLA